jgi:hypothetical protein
MKRDKFICQYGQAFGLCLSRALIDNEVLAVDVPEVAQLLPKCLEQSSVDRCI